ncbi:MAG: hypothetical protein A2289_03710 [Deltaproteobacteria bacterium RIFOXYA12_FULL_58_15]|nr:MAG: hypothetical protein A2289_03710 [Deltaproteobacteria bacterium RIFOXYA12_FULL_58_15]
MGQLVILEFGALRQIESILRHRSPRRIFLVADRTAYVATGAEKVLAPILEAYEVTRFTEFEPNPKKGDVDRGVELFRANPADLIVAVGGGTAIDVGKLINVFAAQEHASAEYIEGRQNLRAPACPLVAVPTTAGTGSEATHFAVIYVDKTKYSMVQPQMQPEVALVDPELLKAAPTRLMASTGMDALAQGIESYWSIYSTDESRRFAAEAINLAWEHVAAATNQPTPAALFGMARAAHLAGRAINLTKTTAPHAISYPITSFFGVPHGHAVALTLPAVLFFNSQVTDDDVLDPRGAGFVRKTIEEIAWMLGVENAGDSVQVLDELMDRVGLSRNFETLGIRTHDDIELIIANGFNPQRVNNNPRRLTEAALRTILGELRGE